MMNVAFVLTVILTFAQAAVSPITAGQNIRRDGPTTTFKYIQVRGYQPSQPSQIDPNTLRSHFEENFFHNDMPIFHVNNGHEGIPKSKLDLAIAHFGGFHATNGENGKGLTVLHLMFQQTTRYNNDVLTRVGDSVRSNVRRFGRAAATVAQGINVDPAFAQSGRSPFRSSAEPRWDTVWAARPEQLVNDPSRFNEQLRGLRNKLNTQRFLRFQDSTGDLWDMGVRALDDGKLETAWYKESIGMLPRW